MHVWGQRSGELRYEGRYREKELEIWSWPESVRLWILLFTQVPGLAIRYGLGKDFHD